MEKAVQNKTPPEAASTGGRGKDLRASYSFDYVDGKGLTNDTLIRS